MEPKIKESSKSLTQTIKHLREVSNNSKLNHVSENRHAAEVGGLRQRTEEKDGSEKAIFPVSVLPPLRMDHFTGREKDLQSIHQYLGLEETPALRTYTIYGRRGIGKTQVRKNGSHHS